jgi:hypothetical protein
MQREREADNARVEREVAHSAGAGNLYPGDSSKANVREEEKEESKEKAAEEQKTSSPSSAQHARATGPDGKAAATAKKEGLHKTADRPATGFDGSQLVGRAFDGSPVTQQWEGAIARNINV